VLSTTSAVEVATLQVSIMSLLPYVLGTHIISSYMHDVAFAVGGVYTILPRPDPRAMGYLRTLRDQGYRFPQLHDGSSESCHSEEEAKRSEYVDPTLPVHSWSTCYSLLTKGEVELLKRQPSANAKIVLARHFMHIHISEDDDHGESKTAQKDDDGIERFDADSTLAEWDVVGKNIDEWKDRQLRFAISNLLRRREDLDAGGNGDGASMLSSWVGEPSSHDNLLQCTSNEYTGVIDVIQLAFVLCALLAATVCLVHTHRASVIMFALSLLMKMSSGMTSLY